MMNKTLQLAFQFNVIHELSQSFLFPKRAIRFTMTIEILRSEIELDNIWIPILSIMVIIYVVIGAFLIRFFKKNRKS